MENDLAEIKEAPQLLWRTALAFVGWLLMRYWSWSSLTGISCLTS